MKNSFEFSMNFSEKFSNFLGVIFCTQNILRGERFVVSCLGPYENSSVCMNVQRALNEDLRQNVIAQASQIYISGIEVIPCLLFEIMGKRHR